MKTISLVGNLIDRPYEQLFDGVRCGERSRCYRKHKLKESLHLFVLGYRVKDLAPRCNAVKIVIKPVDGVRSRDNVLPCYQHDRHGATLIAAAVNKIVVACLGIELAERTAFSLKCCIERKKCLIVESDGAC